VLANIETRGANEVTNVFDEKDIEPLQLDVVQGYMDHVRVEVTGHAGGNLDGGHAVAADALGVVLRLQITLDDSNPHPGRQGLDRCFKQAGLAAARAGHDIHGQYTVLVKVLAIVIGLPVVFVQQVFEHFNGVAAISLKQMPV
jgi:hypothetical protein